MPLALTARFRFAAVWRRVLPARPARPAPRRARGAVTWLLLTALAAHLGLTLLLEEGHPRWRDPEYGRRLARLDARRAERPGRPLALVLGSSRVAMGVRPAASAAEPADGPLLFNYGVIGAGPIFEVMTLRRLLADGIRPDAVFVEFWPPFCARPDEEEVLDPNRLSRADLPVVEPYFAHPERLRRAWQRARLSPWFAHRFYLVSQVVPECLPWYSRPDYHWAGLDGYGWLPIGEDEPPARRAALLVSAFNYYGPLLAHYRMEPAADRALRDLLTLCRTEHIPATLLRMPESSEFRAWYPPAARVAIEAYLADLRGAFGVPILDAREWIADEWFRDGFHLTPTGATTFTRRFDAEVRRAVAGANP